MIPIAELRPQGFSWNNVIKAGVMYKTDLRHYKNDKGAGKFFSINLHDDSGEIKATAFQNQCDKFYDMIQIDRTYYISNFLVKPANKMYTENDYEITFTANTKVEECIEDVESMSSIKYNFVPIKDIALKTPGCFLDVVGVCKSAFAVQELTANITGKVLKKREVILVDDSGGAVVLTLWGEDAEKFAGGTTHPVIAVKGARLTEYNGSKSLSITMLRLNPDLPEAHKLRGWFDNGGADMEIVNISARSMPPFDSSGNNKWITFSDAEARVDKDSYFDLLGVIRFVYADNAVYKACPDEFCNKKLVDLENGLFRCETCNREYPNYKYRLLLTANVSDATDDRYITAFSEPAEVMFGRTSAEIGSLYENDRKEYVQVFEEVQFKTFVFKLQTKTATFKDEAQVKTILINIQPVDYKDANTRLISSIKSITGVDL